MIDCVYYNSCNHNYLYNLSQPLLPSPCTPEDAQLLVQKKYSVNPDLKVVGGFLIRKSFVQSCFDHFQPFVQEKAQKVGVGDGM